MNFEKVKELLNKVVANPDTAQTEAIALLDMLKGDYETLESLKTEKEKSDERIKTLQDTNQRLFLMTTGGKETPDDDEDDLTGFDAVEKFVNGLMEEKKGA